MKPSLLTLPAFFLATGAMFYPQDPPKPAEAVFKNIQVFKGTPAKDIIPAMKFMCASLKVDCATCHDPKDFAADTKNEKMAARHMVEMQKKINADFFEGRLQVTCSSCHNGHEHPNRVPVLPDLSPRHQRFETTMKPEDFFKKYQSAIGGDVKDIVLTGTSTSAKTGSQPTQLTEMGNAFLLTFGSIKVGFDGTTTWHTFEGTPMAADGDTAATLQRMGRDFRGSNPFSQYDSPSVAGKDKVGDKSAIVVRGKVPAGGLTEDLYFDESTGLLLRIVTMTASPIGMVPSIVDLGDYRAVEGVQIPFSMISTSADGEVTTVQFSSAKANSGVDKAIFAMPTK